MARKLSVHPVLFALLALLGLALAPSLASAHEAETGIVTSGSGEVRVRPDSLRIVVGVEAQAETVEAAQNQVNQKMQQVISSLKALKIPNLLLQTRILSVTPVHARTAMGVETAQIVGYQASNAVSASVRGVSYELLARHASSLMTTAIRTGANVSGGLDLFLNDPSTAQRQALEKAVEDAQRNAETIARAAKVTITGIALVRSTGANLPMLNQGPMGGAAAPEVPVEIGEIVVSSNVTVRFTHR